MSIPQRLFMIVGIAILVGALALIGAMLIDVSGSGGRGGDVTLTQ